MMQHCNHQNCNKLATQQSKCDEHFIQDIVFVPTTYYNIEQHFVSGSLIFNSVTFEAFITEQIRNYELRRFTLRTTSLS